MWDLAEQRQIGTPMTGHTAYVMASAALELDGRPVVVTDAGDRTVRFWDLIEQREVREPITGHADRVSAVTVAEWQGGPIVVVGCDDTVRIWDPAAQRYVREVVIGFTREGDVPALAVTWLDGRLIAVTGNEEGIIRL
jgi:WD40 repeat protein